MEILIAVVLAVLATWLAEDLKPWLRKVKFSLVKVATALAPPSERETCEEAWMADADDVDGNIGQIFWALKLSFASLKIRLDLWRDTNQDTIVDVANEYVMIDGIPFADIQATAIKTSGKGYMTLDELDDLEVGDIIKASTAINTDNFIREITGKDVADDDELMNESFWLIIKKIDGDTIHASVDNLLLFPDYHGMNYADVVRLEKRCVIDVIRN